MMHGFSGIHNGKQFYTTMGGNANAVNDLLMGAIESGSDLQKGAVLWLPRVKGANGRRIALCILQREVAALNEFLIVLPWASLSGSKRQLRGILRHFKGKIHSYRSHLAGVLGRAVAQRPEDLLIEARTIDCRELNRRHSY